MGYVMVMAKTKAHKAVSRWRAVRKNSQLWFTPEQMRLVKEAAALEKRPVSTFCLMAVMSAAAKTLKQQENGNET